MPGPQDGTCENSPKVLKVQRFCVGVMDKRTTQNRRQTLFSTLGINSHLTATKIHCIPSLKLKNLYAHAHKIHGRREKVIYGNC
jgi:hypothetical protein